MLAGEALAQKGFVGGGDGKGAVGGALGLEPFEAPSIEEGAEGLHEVVGEGSGAFAGGMADAVEGVEAGGEEGLERLGEKEGISVVEKCVEPIILGGGSGECLDMEGLGAEIPVEMGAGTFFGGGWLGTEDADLVESGGGVRGKGLSERELVGAFGVESLEPECVAETWCGFNLCTGEKGVGGALDGKEDGCRAEVLTEDEGDAVFGHLGQEVATEGAGGGRHEDGRDVLQGYLAMDGAYSAVELSVAAVGFRFFETGDFNEVIGHAGTPVRR